jgi:hypothetical protein
VNITLLCLLRIEDALRDPD